MGKLAKGQIANALDSLTGVLGIADQIKMGDDTSALTLTEAFNQISAVTTERIQNSAVTTNKIADGSVISKKLADSAVTANKIANGSVISKKLADSAVTEDKISDNAVSTIKIEDSAVTEDKLSQEVQAKLNSGGSVSPIEYYNYSGGTNAGVQKSSVIGGKNEATGTNSIALGIGSVANNEAEVAIGRFNKSTSGNSATSTLFSVGIGTDNRTRENAFEIKKNGNVFIGDYNLNTGLSLIGGSVSDIDVKLSGDTLSLGYENNNGDYYSINVPLSGLDHNIFVVVQSLPSAGTTDKIYVTPNPDSEDTGNTYNEYIWVNNNWELVGSFQAETDLSNYYTKSEVDTTTDSLDQRILVLEENPTMKMSVIPRSMVFAHEVSNIQLKAILSTKSGVNGTKCNFYSGTTITGSGISEVVSAVTAYTTSVNSAVTITDNAGTKQWASKITYDIGESTGRTLTKTATLTLVDKIYYAILPSGATSANLCQDTNVYRGASGTEVPATYSGATQHYTGEASADTRFFIAIPKSMNSSQISSFQMNGTPVVMEAQEISPMGIGYWMYKTDVFNKAGDIDIIIL